MSGTTGVSRYQKGETKKVKTNLDLLEQEIVSGSGICWAICKSAPHPRKITMPASYHSVFAGRMPFLPPNQQCHSTESISYNQSANNNNINITYFTLYLGACLQCCDTVG